jgi:hypothetical protein
MVSIKKMLLSIDWFIYRVFYRIADPQPSIQDKDKWGEWFVRSCTRDVVRASRPLTRRIVK